MMTESKPKKLSLKEKLKISLQNTNQSFQEFKHSKAKKDKFKRNLGSFFLNLVKYIVLYGLGFLIIYPILQELAVAFRAPQDINDPMVLWIPKTFSVQNFKIAIIGLDYWNSLRNTIILCFIVTVLQVFITGLVGYAFTRLNFWGSKYLFGVVLFTIIVPPATIALPTYINMTKWQLLNKPESIYLMTALGMGLKSGVFIYLFRQFFRGIPIELEEAAQVDGCGPFKTFINVMLPNARGAITTVSLFAFVWQWNDDYYSSLFTGGFSGTFPLLTNKMTAINNQLRNILSTMGLWGIMGDGAEANPLYTSMIVNTAGVLTMAPLLIGYIFFQDMFIEGVERSGIVG